MKDIIKKIEEEALLEDLMLMVEQDKCMAKYIDEKTGRFKGGKGERWDNCVKAFSECKPDIDNPAGLCAKIARMKGLAPGGKKESEEKPTEEPVEESVGASAINKIANMMINAPMVKSKLEAAVPPDKNPDVYNDLPDLLANFLKSVFAEYGVRVAGKSGALKMMRSLVR